MNKEHQNLIRQNLELNFLGFHGGFTKKSNRSGKKMGNKKHESNCLQKEEREKFKTCSNRNTIHSDQDNYDKFCNRSFVCSNNIIPPKDNKIIYGFIYLSTNTLNQKVYVGQTTRSIEIEWKDLTAQGERLRKKREKNPLQPINARHILNAIAKYNDNDWNLRLIDVGYNKSELNEKERYYIMEVYDSMNREKGYNMTEGGEGTKGYGEKNVPEIKEFLTDIRDSTIMEEILMKYDIDRGTLNKWLEKISGQLNIKNYSTIKRFIQKKEVDDVVKEFDKLRQGQYSKYLEETIETPTQSEITEGLWKSKGYQERVEKGRKKLYGTEEFQRKARKRQQEIWKSPELRKKQSEKTKSSWEKNPEFKEKALEGLEKAHKCRRKALPDIKEFLKTIKNSKSYKDVMGKYNINHPFMQRKIEAILSPFGIMKYVDAKKFLARQNLDKIFNNLENTGHITRLIALGHFKS